MMAAPACGWSGKAIQDSIGHLRMDVVRTKVIRSIGTDLDGGPKIGPFSPSPPGKLQLKFAWLNE